MRRRHLVSLLGTSGLLAAPLFAASDASAAAHASSFQTIDPARWSGFNAGELNHLLQTQGNTSHGFNKTKKPYAVFDWDNTCIMNDCEEALLVYQIDHLLFKLNPQEFAEVLRTGIPNGPFKAEAGYKNVEGKPVLMEDIAADVDANYG